MDKKIRKDVVEWDVINWSRAVDFFGKDSLFNEDLTGKKVLDIGGRNGGMSLLFALKGATVLCTDIEAAGLENAKALHKKYGLENVHYEVVDALTMDFLEEFDIVTFKSVLGGVGFGGNFDNQVKMMANILKALKPGGKLFFVENAVASKLHSFARKKFRPWGEQWRYISLDELKIFAKGYKSMMYKTFGFFGVFGKGPLNNIMGSFDKAFDWIFRAKSKYIVSCIMEKSNIK